MMDDEFCRKVEEGGGEESCLPARFQLERDDARSRSPSPCPPASHTATATTQCSLHYPS